jgi:hypothetical protein
LNQMRQGDVWLRRNLLSIVVLLVILSVGVLTVLQFSKQPKKGSLTVAYVNQVAVDEREFKMLVSQELANVSDYFKQKYQVDDSLSFWTTEVNGEVPIENAKKAALEKIISIKTQQVLAQHYGMLEDLNYQSFLDALSKENGRRQKALATNQVVYGPRQYDESGYYHYLFSNMVIQLKRVLAEKEWPLSQQELVSEYEQLKERHYKRADSTKVQTFTMSYRDAQEMVDVAKKEEAKIKTGQIQLRLANGEAFEAISQDLLKDSVFKWDFEEQQLDGDNDKEEATYVQIVNEAKKLSIGQTSQIFELDSEGYCLIKVIARKAGGYAPYSEVVDNVKQIIIDRKYEEKVKSEIDHAIVKIVDTAFQEIRVR